MEELKVIPNHSGYLISKEGIVLNRVTGKEIEPIEGEVTLAGFMCIGRYKVVNLVKSAFYGSTLYGFEVERYGQPAITQRRTKSKYGLGSVHQTHHYGEVEVVEYQDKRHITVVFKDCGTRKEVGYDSLRTGNLTPTRLKRRKRIGGRCSYCHK